MSDPKQAPQGDPGEHIGVAPHPRRNAALLIGGLVLAAVLGVYYWQEGVTEKAAKLELDDFRQSMSRSCPNEQWTGATQPTLATLYAESRRMRAVVQVQLASLHSSKADCDQIQRALRGVDFPLQR